MGRGHAYRPVKISQRFAMVYNKAGELLRVTPRYFTVSSPSFGECGHKHRSEQAAAPCLRRMMRQWSKKRSKQSKDAWTRRRAAAA